MSKKQFDVFLCYNSEDRSVVKKIADRLDKAGITPWFDDWNLTPGAPWSEVLEDALRRCRSCAVFVGRSGAGPWQRQEMLSALDRRSHQPHERFPVIPVILPGAKIEQDFPPFLLQSPWVEFRTVDDEDSLEQFLKGIQDPTPQESKPVRWTLVLEGTYDDTSKATAEAVANHLRELMHDANLTVKRIDKGSIIIHFEGDDTQFEKLRSDFKEGKFTQVEGMRVLDISKESSREQAQKNGAAPSNVAVPDYPSSGIGSIFVSYSHADAKLLQDIQRALTPLVRSHRLSLWDDRCIKAGNKWRDDINQALGRATSAILLVSQHFLASDFIVNNELPPLLGAAESRGLRIFWIAVSDSLYSESPISAYQCLNDPTRPLDSLRRSKRNAELVRIAKQIRDLS